MSHRVVTLENEELVADSAASLNGNASLDGTTQIDGAAPATTTVDLDARATASRHSKRLQKLIGPNVREMLLDVAERLFAERGVAETSVRAITSEAKANVAAVNYYFGSKEELYQAVINRRLEPLVAERVRLLDVCEQDNASGGPTVEQLMYALVSPSINLCFAHPYFTLLAGRLRVDNDEGLWNDYRSRQKFLQDRFASLFAAALPHLSVKEVELRLGFVLGALLHIWTLAPLPAEQSQEDLLNSFLTFYISAFRAPEPGESGLAIADVIRQGYGANIDAQTSQLGGRK